MFLLFWSKFHTIRGEVLHGLDCNASVASGPEQRSLQREEIALYVQASHPGINKLMALGSKPCKAVLPGVLCGIDLGSSQIPSMPLLSSASSFFSEEITTVGKSYL